MQIIINNLINIYQEKAITKQLPAEGRSMYPLIKQGDNIPIKFIKPENAEVGDIIAFRRDNATIVHRLIKKTDSGFIEKGDNQIRGQFINANAIFGRAEIKRNRINALLGYIIHKCGCTAKPLLAVPFIINAGTRFYIKLRKA